MGLLAGVLGDENTRFQSEVEHLWSRRAGSTISLVNINQLHDQATMDADMSVSLRVALAAAVPRFMPAPGVSIVGEDAWGAGHSTFLKWREVMSDQAIQPVTEPKYGSNFFSVNVRAHEAWDQSAAATLYPKGSTTSIVIPHVFHQERPDGIRSARELYEKTLANNPVLPNGWFAIYTDRDEKGA